MSRFSTSSLSLIRAYSWTRTERKSPGNVGNKIFQLIKLVIHPEDMTKTVPCNTGDVIHIRFENILVWAQRKENVIVGCCLFMK